MWKTWVTCLSCDQPKRGRADKPCAHLSSVLPSFPFSTSILSQGLAHFLYSVLSFPLLSCSKLKLITDSTTALSNGNILILVTIFFCQENKNVFYVAFLLLLSLHSPRSSHTQFNFWVVLNSSQVTSILMCFLGVNITYFPSIFYTRMWLKVRNLWKEQENVTHGQDRE